MTVISPTPGRSIWYVDPDRAAPQAAIVTFVHNDRLINACVFAPDGTPQPRQEVPLFQEGDPTVVGAQCQWVPYQIGQAAKAETPATAA